ncbi:septum formation family protein [Subtercola boreus]|nr:septum formation family protein [Subtercola boreus]
MTISRLTAFLLVVPAVCTVLLLAGCSSASNDVPLSTGAPTARAQDPTPRPTVSAPSVEQTGDVFALAVGDCLNDGTDTHVSEVPTVDCATAHDLEVYYEFDLPDAEAFPGTGPVGDAAETGCRNQFDSFVGVSYDQSILAFTEYVPTETSWGSGDRTVICVLGDPNGKTTGTLRGAAS